MSWTEIFGFVTGAATVLLAVRESPWNWPVGIVNNIFFLILFWKTRLYADALLQIVYIAISIFGWWNWLRGGLDYSVLPIGKTTGRTSVILALAAVAATAALTVILRKFTDNVAPFWDALTTSLSLAAQYLLSRKLLENWGVWMAADVIYVALYCYKSLYLTGILYAAFFIMCISGYFGWRASFATRAVSLPSELGAEPQQEALGRS